MAEPHRRRLTPKADNKKMIKKGKIDPKKTGVRKGDKKSLSLAGYKCTYRVISNTTSDNLIEISAKALLRIIRCLVKVRLGVF
jgi:hypothetical protein